MVTKTNKVIFSFITLLFLFIFFIYTFPIFTETYGNDTESIKKVITSIEGYESDSIEILDIKDMNDNRIVGFLIDNHPAYIQFYKNKKGNYKWYHIQKSENQSFVPYLITMIGEGSPSVLFIIVTTKENEISKLELGVNNHIIEQDFILRENAVSWIELPQSDSNEFSYTWKYFDENGIEIK
ncbi:hypothetical protein [Bacillus suaedaesalsae]|uniref:DUF4825 domain-containing protein n=1 Tax=Bacillus suaedaesalsae TaxID=2810349 RepID=A0ABS2DJU2_9BACI|nr:hypothetical protein [Bacillus suaedaesalsae]MBM6618772.1 hypothetical protein [Bacillus suaedaesalsae]